MAAVHPGALATGSPTENVKEEEEMAVTIQSLTLS
jgi:hypothetical protein